jgi:hypothetical protein
MIKQEHLQNRTTMKNFFLPLSSVGTVVIAVALSSTVLFAQDKPQASSPPNTGTRSEYGLKIVNGQLLVDDLKDRINVNAKFGPGNIHSVAATLGNIVDVLLELHTNANIVMMPGLAKMKITDLKMRSTHEADDSKLQKELQALTVASGYKFRWRRELDPEGSALAPGSSLYILSYEGDAAKPSRSVEVFNLSAYIEQLGKQDGKEIEGIVEKIGTIINHTVQSLKSDDFTSEDLATFEFHPGASLLIVIGPSESLDVARKVVTALPGVTGSADVGASLGGGDRFTPGISGNMNEMMRKRYGLGPMPAPPSVPGSRR